MKFQINAKIQETKRLSENTFFIRVFAPEIASEARAGQFCQVKVRSEDFPLLRRPLSIALAENGSLSFLFNVVGTGTRLLSVLKEGDEINLLGPLGQGFSIQGSYDTAVFLAGGIGVAPFRFLTKSIEGKKEILSLLGARTSSQLLREGLLNVSIATDDGSLGFKGNLVELLGRELSGNLAGKKIRVFACGPTPMLAALREFVIPRKIETEISLEGPMACGTGMCKGCVVKSAIDQDYRLACKDGPVFNVEEILL